MGKKPIGITFFIVVFTWQAIAFADENPWIQAGIEQYNNLEYEKSINTLSAALIRPGNTREQKIEIYKYLGLNYLILGRQQEAEGAFRSLLAIDESWSFDPMTTAPKVVEFFEDVKKRWIAEGKPGVEKKPSIIPVRVKHKLPSKAIEKQSLNLEIEVENPEKKQLKVSIVYRNAKSKEFHETGAELSQARDKVESYIAQIPDAAVVPPYVEYYIKVTDLKNELIASKGDENLPLRVMVPEKRKKKGWLWGLLGGGGAVAIALSITLPLVLKRGEGSPSNNNHKTSSVTIFVCEEGTPGC